MYIKTDPDKGETRPSCGIFGMWKMFPSGWNPLTFPIWWIFCENNADWRRVGPGLVAHCYSWCQAPGPPWPRLGSSPRDQMLSDQSELSSEQWWQSPGTWSPGHTCKHHTALLTVLARPGGSVLLGTPDSNIRESQRAASCVSSLSDLGPHQWPGDWFNDIPLHTSIHYHWTSPPRMPHIARWIYHIH